MWQQSTLLLLFFRGTRPSRGLSHSFQTVFSLGLPEGRCVGVSLLHHENDDTESSANVSLRELQAEEFHFPINEHMCQLSAVNFWGGRLATRRAIKCNDKAPPILRSMNGAPILPWSYRGSITHKYPVAASLVVNQTQCIDVGIDLEIARLSNSDTSRLARRILSSVEIDSLANLHSVPFSIRPRLCFSIKEAVYKAVASVLGPITLREIAICPHPDGGCGVSVPAVLKLQVQATWRLVSCPIATAVETRYILATAAVHPS